jgi:DNA-3-methyladenine glycosylase II
VIPAAVARRAATARDTRPRGLTPARLQAAARHLAGRDADLAAILERHGPPPMWGRRPGFDTLVRIILEQQVSLASGAAIYRRLAGGIDPFTPETCAAAGEARVRALGVTRQKSGYIVALARAVAAGLLDLGRLAALPDDRVRATLTGLKGIGPWSADIYLLMALRRPDVWPAADLALLSAARRVKRLRRPPSPERMTVLAEAWRPWRSVAARMLWQHYLAERDRSVPAT